MGLPPITFKFGRRIIPPFEKEGARGDLQRRNALQGRKIPLNPPFSKGEAITAGIFRQSDGWQALWIVTNFTAE
jgi:hypothetical protein